MKSLILSVLSLLTCVYADAQNLRKGFKHLTNNEVNDAVEIFNEGILKYPACPVSNYGLAVVEVEKKVPPDFFKAFRLIRTAVNSSSDFSTKKEYAKLDEYVTSAAIYGYFEKIDLLLLNHLRGKNSIPEVERFLSECGESEHMPAVIALRDSLEFIRTREVNTIAAYSTYISKFPSSRQRVLAVSARNRLHYEAAVANNTIAAFKQFIADFPDAEEVILARQACARLAFEAASGLNTILAYKKFLGEYPGADQANEATERIMLLDFDVVKSSNTAEEYNRFLRAYPNSAKEKQVRGLLAELEFARVMALARMAELRKFKVEFPDASVARLHAVDSLIKVKERLIPLFPGAENYRIACLHKRDLWIMYEDGTGRRRITTSGRVISFTSDGSVIYFGEKRDENLDIFSYDLGDVIPPKKLVTLKGQRDDFFEAFNLSSGGSLYLMNPNSLCVAANFECCEGAGFRDSYMINLADLSFTYYPNSGCDQQAVSGVSETSETFQTLVLKSTDEKNGSFISKKTGKEHELFYLNPQRQAIQLTHTQEYSPRECWGEKITDFDYARLRSGKVVYAFVFDCGDQAHSILGMVNIDGTHEKIISTDFMPFYQNYMLLRSNGELACLSYDSDSETTNLVVFTGSSNEKYVLMKDVSSFEFIPAPGLK